MLATVLLPWLMTGKIWVLTDFEDMLMHVCFIVFLINSLITVTVITFPNGNHISQVLCLSFLSLF